MRYRKYYRLGNMQLLIVIRVSHFKLQFCCIVKLTGMSQQIVELLVALVSICPIFNDTEIWDCSDPFFFLDIDRICFSAYIKYQSNNT